MALDVDGKVYAIPKWTSLKAKDVNAKLGSPEKWPSVGEAKTTIRQKLSGQMREFVDQIKDRQNRDLDPLRDKLRGMNEALRSERHKLKVGQNARWIEETKARSDRLNKGLRSMFDRPTVSAKSIRRQNELEASNSARRDQKQRDFMVVEQMKERRKLHREFLKLRTKHRQERELLAQDMRQTIAMKPTIFDKDLSLDRSLRLSI